MNDILIFAPKQTSLTRKLGAQGWGNRVYVSVFKNDVFLNFDILSDNFSKNGARRKSKKMKMFSVSWGIDFNRDLGSKTIFR